MSPVLILFCGLPHLAIFIFSVFIHCTETIFHPVRRDSNPQPFNHESNAITTRPSCSPPRSDSCILQPFSKKYQSSCHKTSQYTRIRAHILMNVKRVRYQLNRHPLTIFSKSLFMRVLFDFFCTAD